MPAPGDPTTIETQPGIWYRVATWAFMGKLYVRCGGPFRWEINSAHPPFHEVGNDNRSPFYLTKDITWTLWWGECRIMTENASWVRSSYRGDPGSP